MTTSRFDLELELELEFALDLLIYSFSHLLIYILTTKTKKIGTWAATSLVLGNMIGSGVFLLPASLAVYGGISIFGWIVSSIGALLLAKVFSTLSKNFPKAGGPYAYTRMGFGDFPAFLVAWGYWISICATNAAITVALLSYLTVFFPALSGNTQI